VGEHIRVRGSFGEELQGTVLTVSLLQVLLETEQGVLRLPNTGVNEAAVGPCRKAEPDVSETWHG
jgi:hypothetical protein